MALLSASRPNLDLRSGPSVSSSTRLLLVTSTVYAARADISSDPDTPCLRTQKLLFGVPFIPIPDSETEFRSMLAKVIS